MRRTSILISSALILAGFGSQPAMSKDIGPKSKDYIEGKCNEEGGTYWATTDGASWGCGYKGGGGVICDKGGNGVDPWCEETTSKGRNESELPLGLAGLLGLIGLAGLANRPRRSDQLSK